MSEDLFNYANDRLAHIDRADPSFEADLQGSKKSVVAAMLWLNEQGFSVIMPRPLPIRENINDICKYSDDGDFFVQLPVEVKHRPNLQFTCAEDFPFPTVMLDRKDRVVGVRPWLYITLNGPMTHAVIVRGSTSKHWVLKGRFHGARGRYRTKYECPVELATFRDIRSGAGGTP